jgi:hypothetical protein
MKNPNKLQSLIIVLFSLVALQFFLFSYPYFKNTAAVTMNFNSLVIGLYFLTIKKELAEY